MFSLIGLGLAALFGYGAYSISEANTEKKKQASASQQQARLAERRQSDLGNLTTGEAKMSASKKMFREGLYFTSPTGLGTSGGARGRSRLMGS